MEPSSHIVYKVLYVNSFYSLYYCHHYDHCSVNIAIWYYMQTWSLYIIKIIYGLFACLCDSTSGYTDNSKPIFLFLVFVLENTVCLCGSCLSPSLSTEVLLVKLLLKQLQSARLFEKRLVVLNHCRLT